MNQTGFVFHEDYLKHDTGHWHPESPARLESIISHLEESGKLSQLEKIEPRSPCSEWILKIHTSDYISHVRESALYGIDHLDADTGIGRESYRIACLAVGGILEAVDAIIANKVSNAFCAVRPPGHHAEQNHAMGFCLFNNVAIAAKYIQIQFQLEKVLIVDWDVHHGNGTQNSFYEDPTVLYFSVHQHPFYPGTGYETETGSGAGTGFTLNKPLSAGADDSTYIDIFNSFLLPAAKKFKPDFILISAGFDAHQKDPLAAMKMTADGFGRLTQIIKEFAEEQCHGRILSTLEGGYHLDSLGQCVEKHIQVLMK